MENFSFKNDDLRLDATIFYPPNKQNKYSSILFVHGWTSERSRSFQYAKALAKLGYICMLFDLRGRGTSEGKFRLFTIKDFLNDVTNAYDYLSKLKNVDKNNINAIGSSFGGYLVSILSAKRKVKNLVLRAPATYPDEIFNKPAILGSLLLRISTLWMKKTKRVFEALQSYKGNVLIIESEKDNTIPHKMILSYVNAIKNKNNLTHVILKNAPHSIKEGKFRDEVEKILTEWFKDKL